MAEKMCAATRGKRVAAHKSRTPGKLFAVPRRRPARRQRLGDIEQTPCQSRLSIENKDLDHLPEDGTGDVNCQVVTDARRLRHQQARLGMLLELVAEPPRRGLIRNARLQPVQLPAR